MAASSSSPSGSQDSPGTTRTLSMHNGLFSEDPWHAPIGPLSTIQTISGTSHGYESDASDASSTSSTFQDDHHLAHETRPAGQGTKRAASQEPASPASAAKRVKVQLNSQANKPKPPPASKARASPVRKPKAPPAPPVEIQHGSRVLAKFANYPPWPAMVIGDDHLTVDQALNKPKSPCYCVKFIPAGDFSWIHPNKVKPLEQQQVVSYLDKHPPKAKDTESDRQVRQAYSSALHPDEWFQRELRKDKEQDMEVKKEHDTGAQELMAAAAAAAAVAASPNGLPAPLAAVAPQAPQPLAQSSTTSITAVARPTLVGQRSHSNSPQPVPKKTLPTFAELRFRKQQQQQTAAVSAASPLASTSTLPAANAVRSPKSLSPEEKRARRVSFAPLPHEDPSRCLIPLIQRIGQAAADDNEGDDEASDDEEATPPPLPRRPSSSSLPPPLVPALKASPPAPLKASQTPPLNASPTPPLQKPLPVLTLPPQLSPTLSDTSFPAFPLAPPPPPPADAPAEPDLPDDMPLPELGKRMTELRVEIASLEESVGRHGNDATNLRDAAKQLKGFAAALVNQKREQAVALEVYAASCSLAMFARQAEREKEQAIELENEAGGEVVRLRDMAEQFAAAQEADRAQLAAKNKALEELQKRKADMMNFLANL